MKLEENEMTGFRLLHVAAVCLALSAIALAGGGTGDSGGGIVLEFTTGGDPVTVTVTGRVTDAAGGAPIAGALVRGNVLVWANRPEIFEKAAYQVARTDDDGRYRMQFATQLTMSGPQAGEDSLCVYVYAEGYAPRHEFVRPYVTAASTDFGSVDFALEPGSRITGKVVDADGQPLAGVRVEAQNGYSGVIAYFGAMGRTRSDRDGCFELWVSKIQKDNQYAPRWYEFHKEAYGWAFGWDVESNHLGEVTVPEGATVEGRVMNLEGVPVAGCPVAARTMMWATVGTTVTDQEGRYVLTGLPGKPGVVEFFKTKNKTWMPLWGEVTVFARMDADASLKTAAQYKIIPDEGKVVSGPDLVVGAGAYVAGTLIPPTSTFPLKGLLLRLDYDWDFMVEADAAGRFRFPSVPPGKHRLTAYLPMNLRGDRGIGSTEITTESGKPVEGAKIELEALTEVRVQFVDLWGNLLEGVTAGATWSADGSGFWTEGTKSGADGWAVLYLYPGSKQYVRGFDHSERKLVAANHEEVEPREGEVIDYVRITMVEAAGIKGRFVDEAGAPVAGKRVSLALSYADGSDARTNAETDTTGAFTVKPHLRPGIVSLSAETAPLELKGASLRAVEVTPGSVTDLGVVRLQKVPFYKVEGKVVPSSTVTKIDGLKIRLDLTGPWELVGETDAEGRFEVEVPEGEHRLTAYVPWNLRFDPGIGHVEVSATADQEGVELPLDNLAVIRMTIVDQNGAPLEGMSGITTFREDMSGPGNQGPPSDENGLSTIYVCPGHDEYAAPFDKGRKLRWKEVTKVNLEEGEVIEMTGVLVPAEEE